MRRLCALALLAALGAAFVVSEVHAQAFVIPQWYNPTTNQRITVQPGAQTGFPTVEQDKDRDFPLITNLFDGQSLASGATYTMSQGIPLMQYTRASLMLTWTCTVADTDSVRIAVKVYGMTNSTSGNWYLWTPLATYTNFDTCYTEGQVDADSTGTGRCLKPISFWVGKGTTRPFRPAAATIIPYGTGLYEGTLGAPAATTARVRIRKVPMSCLRWGSANGVILNLCDNAGNPLITPYIRIEVTNCSISGNTLSNVAANIWPRVQ